MKLIYRQKIFFLVLFNIIIPNNTVLKVLSYNIHGLPELLTPYKNSNRIEEIVHEVSNYDLAFLQENWVYQGLIKKNFSKDNYIIGSKNKFFKRDKPKRSSGLNIITSDKINIYDYQEYEFTNCNGWLVNANDCFASKGFIYSKLLIDNDTLNVYVTHLDAGESDKDLDVREKQMIELSRSIEKISNSEPLIICGDFNIDYYSNQDIIDNFVNKFSLINLDWDLNLKNKFKIDYVFYRNGTSTKIIVYDEGINSDLINHSDHYPIEFKIILTKVEQLKITN